MPELPDVETLKRTLDGTSLKHRIHRVELDARHMLRGASAARVRRALEGSSFRETARHGKYLFVRLGRGGWLVLHFGMTGTLCTGRADEDLPKHARLVVRFATGRRLAGIWQRRLGRIDLAESPAEFIERQALGPDAFEPGVERHRFRDILATRRGGVKSALIDQGFIAGVGNIYGDEILYQAGIDRDRQAPSLGDDGANALHAKMDHVLRLAIERQADPQRVPRSWLLPHRKEGEPCLRCDGTIRRKKSAGRSTYFCPDCQT